MQSDELKELVMKDLMDRAYPCRCCGRKPIQESIHVFVPRNYNIFFEDDFTLVCSECGANTYPFSNEMAIHKWNARNEKHNPFIEVK